MTDVTEHPTRLPRVAKLTAEKFVSDYVGRNQPVVIADAMDSWPALTQWTPAHLAQRFGDEYVQVYGDLFQLINLMPLSQYFDRYFDRTTEPVHAGKAFPYVRWYCHLSQDDRVPWADDAFERMSHDWACPDCFPRDSFVLPYCGNSELIDPSRDWFPARGLFISAQGARTRLHADPWCSDALLCQLYGRKDFVMFDPSQTTYLSNAGNVVDIEAPDTKRHPDFWRASPCVQDTLEVGEIVFVPAGWHHHFKSVTDSISLTWNFVHLSRLQEFTTYLRQGPSETEKKQLCYAFFHAPGRKLVDHDKFIRNLAQSAPWLDEP
jgi:cupin-like protein